MILVGSKGTDNQMGNTIESINKKLDFLSRNTVISLLIIGTISVLVRMYFFPYNVPLTLDAFEYFLYATDVSILGHIPSGYSFPNTGWPIFLSIFFMIFHSNNFIDYMTLQRVVSVSISTLTFIPVYLLCTRFFDKRYSLIGASLFAFEPHIIQNSVLGITEPLYIFLTAVVFSLFLSDKKKFVYLSFALAALCTTVRYEGIFLFIIISIVFIVRFRKEKNILLKCACAFGIFSLLLIPVAYVRVQTLGYDGLTSNWTGGITSSIKITSENNNGNHLFALVKFVGVGVFNLAKYFGWTSIPYWIFFVPFGIYLILRKITRENLITLLTPIILSVPALYAYAREIQDPRYLYVLFPMYCVLSVFAIQRLIKKTKNENFYLILIIGGILLSSGIYLEIKQYDYAHQREAFALTQHIVEMTKGVNNFYPEDSFIVPAELPKKWPMLKSSLFFNTKVISTEGFDSLKDYIKNSENKGLTHLVIDDRQNRPTFLKDVFYHEEKYPYLIKIYDSSDNGFKYHLKIYRIDYNKFDSHE